MRIESFMSKLGPEKQILKRGFNQSNKKFNTNNNSVEWSIKSQMIKNLNFISRLKIFG